MVDHPCFDQQHSPTEAGLRTGGDPKRLATPYPRLLLCSVEVIAAHLIVHAVVRMLW